MASICGAGWRPRGCLRAIYWIFWVFCRTTIVSQKKEKGMRGRDIVARTWSRQGF